MNATVTTLHPVRTAAPSRLVRATEDRTPRGLRLTRRGRIVVSLLTFLTVLAIGAAALLLVVRPAAGAAENGVESVTVQAGQTVWGLAAGSGAAQPSEFVHEVQMLNNLSGSGITAGSTILVPVVDAD